MDVTFLGHAGMLIEAGGASILCDPWFNPAYFASWFPFPANDGIDLEPLRRPDFLFVSHLHRDHFDPDFLRRHVSKDATVLLPAYPLDLLERSLRDLGFHSFVTTRNHEPVDLGGLTVAITALVAPTDGPIGDSGLWVDDGTTRLFNQNDSRPVDIERLLAMGSLDAHFLQFSGAIWYPFVYDIPPAAVEALGRKKRANQMARALRYIEELKARWVFPSAGPPCLLDDSLFHLNDFERTPSNIFPDQSAFLDYLREAGHEDARLVLPGSRIHLDTGGGCSVAHALPEPEVARIFLDKRAVLEEYRDRKRPVIEAAMASLPDHQVALLPALQDWFLPLLDKADITCAGIGGVVVLDLGDERIAVDFRSRTVQPWDGEEWHYLFRFDRRIIERLVLDHVEDWVNSAFLSFRFQARRKGPFNEFVYNFFKCLSMERLQYAEGFYSERNHVDQFCEMGGYTVQRRCPHLKADLARFGTVEDGVLTCALHGWQFDLASGRCLTSDAVRLYSRPSTPPPVVEVVGLASLADERDDERPGTAADSVPA